MLINIVFVAISIMEVKTKWQRRKRREKRDKYVMDLFGGFNTGRLILL
jgi:uncharacterized protein (DUF1919 family)